MNVTMIGLGSIGRGLIPLLRKHVPEIEHIDVLTADPTDPAIEMSDWEEAYNVDVYYVTLTAENFQSMIPNPILAKKDHLVINVSVGVSSQAMVEWCRDQGHLYIDTCVEPWAGEYEGSHVTNAMLRRNILNLRGKGNPTAIVAHGANPGLVTHLAKKGLEEFAVIRGLDSWKSYADLSMKLGIKVIQIAERDTQYETFEIFKSSDIEKFSNTFHNTWSAEGFISELYYQFGEIGLGSHEEMDDMFTTEGTCVHSVTLKKTGMDLMVRSWVPSIGETVGNLITHHEAISLCEFLTEKEHAYAPTVYYAYQPTMATTLGIEGLRRGYIDPSKPRKKVMYDPSLGYDELGVLFITDMGSFWYGSTLKVEEAKRLMPFNNATSLQVNASLMAAIKWMLKHPNEGVIEAEDINHEPILRDAMPYLGSVRGVSTSWRPLAGLEFRHFYIQPKSK